MDRLKKIKGICHAVFTLLILMISTAIGSIPILLLGLLKLIPHRQWQCYCTKGVDKLATLWSDINNIYLDKIHPARWEVSGVDDFDPLNWYLVVANHQSWLDIVILQRLFNRKIPVLKFFIKDQLKWIPFLGFSWWAMGCPFMKRYSAAYLAKNPHKIGKDLIATKKALKTFKQTPASIMSFVEGTRYSSQKKSQQQSPYQYLLKPKAGGVGFVIDAMGQQINELLDVTIVYPHEQHSLWNFLCRKVDSVKVNIRRIPIPEHFLKSSLYQDETKLSSFYHWLNNQWAEKDLLIAKMKAN